MPIHRTQPAATPLQWQWSAIEHRYRLYSLAVRLVADSRYCWRGFRLDWLTLSTF